MAHLPKSGSRWFVAVFALLHVLVSGIPAPAAKDAELGDLGPVEHEVRSKYSHIRIRRKADVRTMLFVRDNGQEVGETKIDLKNPHHLLVPYTQVMFASYLFRPEPKRVLIVGLGGGAMVQFLQHHQPDVRVDAIEIDPEVVKIAKEYFGTQSKDRIRILTQDAFDYLKTTEERYDVIFMDAFLEPSRDTDTTGVPLRLKTIQFLKQVQTKLNAGGVVAFNLNPSRRLRSDMNTIRNAFPQAYVFSVVNSQNLVVIGSTSRMRKRNVEFVPVARQLDEQFQANFSFQDVVKRIK